MSTEYALKRFDGEALKESFRVRDLLDRMASEIESGIKCVFMDSASRAHQACSGAIDLLALPHRTHDGNFDKIFCVVAKHNQDILLFGLMRLSTGTNLREWPLQARSESIVSRASAYRCAAFGNPKEARTHAYFVKDAVLFKRDVRVSLADVAITKANVENVTPLRLSAESTACERLVKFFSMDDRTELIESVATIDYDKPNLSIEECRVALFGGCSAADANAFGTESLFLQLQRDEAWTCPLADKSVQVGQLFASQDSEIILKHFKSIAAVRVGMGDISKYHSGMVEWWYTMKPEVASSDLGKDYHVFSTSQIQPQDFFMEYLQNTWRVLQEDRTFNPTVIQVIVLPRQHLNLNLNLFKRLKSPVALNFSMFESLKYIIPFAESTTSIQIKLGDHSISVASGALLRVDSMEDKGRDSMNFLRMPSVKNPGTRAVIIMYSVDHISTLCELSKSVHPCIANKRMKSG